MVLRARNPNADLLLSADDSTNEADAETVYSSAEERDEVGDDGDDDMDDRKSEILQADAEQEDAETPSVLPETPVPSRSRRRARSFSSVMRDSYDDTITTPWDQMAYRRRRSFKRKSSRVTATQESDELSPGTAVRLGRQPQDIAQAGQSSLASSMSPSSHRGRGGSHAPHVMGRGRGGHGAGRGQIARSSFAGDLGMGGIGGSPFHRRTFDETATVAAESAQPTAQGVDLDDGEYLSDRDADREEVQDGASELQVGEPVDSELPLVGETWDIFPSSPPWIAERELDWGQASNAGSEQAHGDNAETAEVADSSDDEVPELRTTPDYVALWTTGPYRGCRTALAARAYIHARELGWTNLDAATFKQNAAVILCSMPTVVLNQLIKGNLAQLRRRHNWYSESSALLARGDKEAPVVYASLLVDKETGDHVSRVRLAEVAKVLRRYVTVAADPNDPSVDEAVSVDNAYRMPSHATTRRKHIRAGRHRFLWQASADGVGKRKAKRIAVIQSFCDAVERNCKRYTTKTLPLQYIGYALCISTRTPAHAKGEGSSFLLQLVRHVLQMLYPGQYDLESYPVFFACDAEETILGERLLTLLGHGLAASGRGLGIHSAGLNASSADMGNCSAEDVTRIWSECRAFRRYRGWFADSMKNEAEVIAHIEANQDDDYKRQAEKLKELEQKRAELEQEFEERYGSGLAHRIGEDIQQGRDAVDELAEAGGEDAEALVALFRADLDADSAELQSG